MGTPAELEGRGSAGYLLEVSLLEAGVGHESKGAKQQVLSTAVHSGLGNRHVARGVVSGSLAFRFLSLFLLL